MNITTWTENYTEEEFKAFHEKLVKEAHSEYLNHLSNLTAAVENFLSYRDSVEDTVRSMRERLPYGDGWVGFMSDAFKEVEVAKERVSAANYVYNRIKVYNKPVSMAWLQFAADQPYENSLELLRIIKIFDSAKNSLDDLKRKELPSNVSWIEDSANEICEVNYNRYVVELMEKIFYKCVYS